MRTVRPKILQEERLNSVLEKAQFKHNNESHWHRRENNNRKHSVEKREREIFLFLLVFTELYFFFLRPMARESVDDLREELSERMK